jgi:hypothetical protein
MNRVTLFQLLVPIWIGSIVGAVVYVLLAGRLNPSFLDSHFIYTMFAYFFVGSSGGRYHLTVFIYFAALTTILSTVVGIVAYYSVLSRGVTAKRYWLFSGSVMLFIWWGICFLYDCFSS